jgi:MYXO-CTERM domain-containing protein
MSHGHPTRRRRIVTRAAPLLLALGALPLLAPTCGPGTEGVKTFAQYSLIIPMDRCYQYQVDAVSGTAAPAGCPQAPDAGDVIKAYGLVYQLIRNDVAVYWVIDQTKQSSTAYDLSLQYDGGFPAQSYDWASGGKGSPPTTGHLIRYMGGPFVVDGSDYAKASAVLQRYKNAGFGNVNVHVSNVAFQGYVKKTLAGGWSAGGPVPPKIALLDIGSGELSKQTKPLCDSSKGVTTNCLCNPAYPKITNCTAICTSPSDTTHNCDAEYCVGTVKNSQQVIEGYLTWAGIGGSTSCADPNDCPGGKASGPHGQIYDRLTMADFQPAPGGDWTTTSFYKNSADGRASAGFKDGSGYQLLWVPHWTAPGSCAAPPYDPNDNVRACACLASRYTAGQVDNALLTIGKFVQAGNDLFGECSGLGSFEGVLDSANTPTLKFGDAIPETHFQTSTGMKINQKSVGTPKFWGSWSSPLMQLGDYTFKPVSGAIAIYRPATGAYAATTPTVTKLVSDATDETLDYFTMLPSVLDTNNVPTRGSVVYMAGHSYNQKQADTAGAQIGGSRLVLNTLFNLGAGCTESGVACDTGKLGVCARGVLACSANGIPECQQVGTIGPESCNGLDDDCDGLVDEDLETGCYDELVAGVVTRGKGLCTDGIRTCERRQDGTYGMSACQNQVGPAPEVCNALDDDCDGQIDEGLQQACYFGPQATLDGNGVPIGSCKPGLQTCSGGNWGECKVCTTETTGTPAYTACQILPRPEVCVGGGVQQDENCDGIVNESNGGEGCGTCGAGTTQTCYTGPAGTASNGLCHTGEQTCGSGSWGPCFGEKTPTPELCSPAGVDEDCDGQVDEGCGCTAPVPCYDPPAGVSAATAGVGVCKTGLHACQDGVEVGACQGQVLPGVEVCDAQDNDCDGATDENPDTLCSTGYTCVTGVCVPRQCGIERPCPEGFSCQDEAAGIGHCGRDVCGARTVCTGATQQEQDAMCPSGQACVSGECQCKPGLSCSAGQCLDRCDPNPCGAGSFCSSGACVGGSCYYTGCDAGSVCKEGTCVPDACTGSSCPAGTFCRAGDCVQSCAFIDCTSGQRCGNDGFCEPDACAGKTCAPAQKCVNGACVADACAGIGCGTGQVCDGGVCVDDPCTGVVCPVGRCSGGQCFPAGNPASVGEGEATKSGCGCGSAGEAAPLWALLFLALAPLARRRRAPRGGALLVVLAGVVLLGSACKTSDFDPSQCQTVCEGEDRCIDVYADPGHCGGCGKVCDAGDKCVDRVCGPAGGVAPFIASLTPSHQDQGSLDPVPVRLKGLRFAQGATVRLTSPSGSTAVPATRDPATGDLLAQLDLSEAPAAELLVRVVNPDHVISNAARFDVTQPSPHVDRIVPQPSPARAGAPVTLLVQGTGFIPSSRCVVKHLTYLPEQALTTALGAEGLTCVLDGTNLPPAAGYQLWVVNPASPSSIVSNTVSFTLDSQDPVLTALSPSYGGASEVVAMAVSGSGFDVTSVVLFNGNAVPTTFVDSGQLYVAQLQLPGCGSTSCSFPVKVRNGTSAPSYRLSGAATFTVGAPPPSVTGLSPASAYQGTTVTLTFTGNGFSTSPAPTIELQPPGGTFSSAGVTPASSTATSVSGSVSFAQKPEGFWLARLRFDSVAVSSAFSLRVLSSQIVLQGASPRGASAGLASVPVTLTATNLRPLPSGDLPAKGIRALFNTGGASVTIAPTGVNITSAPSGTGTVTISVDTRALDTGNYTLQLANPDGAARIGGATPSNALSFNVTPGVPTVSGLCLIGPSGCAPNPQVPRQDDPVYFKLTGTNFAKPDASGVGGSSVHVSAPSINLEDYAIPAATPAACASAATQPVGTACILSPTEIRVKFDTRTGIPGALYSVAVWNPGGTGGQKSVPPLPDALKIL